MAPPAEIADHSEEDEGVTESSFVVACAETKDSSVSWPFAELTAYERTSEPAQARFRAFSLASKALDERVESAMDSIYAMILEHLQDFVVLNEPSTQVRRVNSLGSQRKISAGIVTGIAPDASLVTRLRRKVKSRSPPILFLKIQPSEATSLQLAIKSFLSKLALQAQSTRLSLSNALEDLYEFAEWYDGLSASKRPRLVIHLPCSEAFDTLTLSDFILALDELSRDTPSIAPLLLFETSSNIPTLRSCLSHNAFARLDVERFELPDRDIAFAKLIEETLAKPTKAQDLFLASDALAFIRERFQNSGSSLTETILSFKTVLQLHYSLSPLSVLGSLPKRAAPDMWTADFLALVRRKLLSLRTGSKYDIIAFGEADDDGAGRRLRTLSEDADILTLVPNLVALQDDASRLWRFGFAALCLADEWIESVSSEERRIGTAAISGLPPSNVQRIPQLMQFALKGDCLNALKPLRKALRGDVQPESVDSLLKSLSTLVTEHSRVLPHANAGSTRRTLETIKQELRERRNPFESAVAEELGSARKGIDKHDATTRRLQRAEHLRTERNRLSDWLRATITTALSDPVLDIPTMRSPRTTTLALLRDPSPRTSLFAALNDPLPSLHPALPTELSDPYAEAWTGEHLPDLTRAFRGYKRAGSLINLADWYSDFRSGLEEERRVEKEAELVEIGGGKRARGQQTEDASDGNHDEVTATPSRKSKRAQLGNGAAASPSPSTPPSRRKVANGSKTSQEEDRRWEADTHVRFTMAVNELASLGLLRKTRRKAEHVIRTVFDLCEDV